MKIEEGKFYKRTDGSILGPAKSIDPCGKDGAFRWDVGGQTFTDDGHFYSDQKHSQFDLFQESTGALADIKSAFAAALPEHHDPVNHPQHYTSHPSGVECIVVTEHMNFCRGNAVKYIWRAGDKGDEVEDLKKARWYLDREIERLSKPT